MRVTLLFLPGEIFYHGRIPFSIRPLSLVLSLLHFLKNGGVIPIAVGCTLRCLVAKVACLKVRDEAAALWSLRQLGFGVKGGMEAAIHAMRLYLSDLDQKCLFKLDFKNASMLCIGTGCSKLFSIPLPCCTSLFTLVISAPSGLTRSSSLRSVCSREIHLAPSFFAYLFTQWFLT